MLISEVQTRNAGRLTPFGGDATHSISVCCAFESSRITAREKDTDTDMDTETDRN